MTNRKLSLIAALAAFTAITGCAEKTKSTPHTDEGPAFWLVSDEDSDIYLFGTFHILPASVSWTTPAFDAAMAATPITMTEADVASPQAQAAMGGLVLKYGTNPPGVTLSSILGPERAEVMRELADRYDVPVSMLEPMRPWLALVSLTTIAMQESGFDPSSGAESKVLARARKENDTIDYFETAEFQIKALANLDEEEMLGNFDAAVVEFEDFDAYAERMLTAWRTGDIETIETEVIGSLRTESPRAFETLIISRNKTWAGRIKEIMAGDDDVFIAVGAGHLVGEGSVVELMKEAGFKVERIQ